MTPDPDDPAGKDFLSRWSARKRAEPEGGASVKAEPAAKPEPPDTPEPDADLLASLPPIDQIGAGTDIRAFLQKGVPTALRNAALRRAWATNPAIAGYEDPARDYFWDWNAPGGVPGGGGRLTTDAVARMADRIFSGAPREAPREPPAAADIPPAAEPVPTEDPAPQATAAVAEPTTGPAPLPSRRHGGATPA